MLSSGDSLLLSILAILIPALGILVGTGLYASSMLRRYSRALTRLYSSSFKGVDSERKRIARELHDHLGAHSVLMSDGFEKIKKKSLTDISEKLYEKGYSCLDIVDYITDSKMDDEKKFEYLVFIQKIKKEFRDEKLLMGCVLNFLLIRSDYNLENISFM